MAYTFFIDGLRLPVAPPELQVKIKNQNRTITLINDGEVNILKTAGLTEISFDACIPQVRYPWASYPGGFKSADYFLDKFEQLKASQEPFLFSCLRTLPNGRHLFDTDMMVSLEDYQIKESAADGFDLTVSVNLKQYREYGTKIVEVTEPSAPGEPQIARVIQARPAGSPPRPDTYTVASGDTLWNIAKKCLGDGELGREIFKLNKDKAGTQDLLYPGQVLILPKE